MNIREKVSKFITKYGTKICVFAVFATAASVSTCRALWYQPKEPDGFDEFMKDKLK